MAKASPKDHGVLFNLAGTFAILSGKIADKKQEYADRAMELLQMAVLAGYKNAAYMAKDIDLVSLHGREDFQKLLRELETKKEKAAK